MISIFLKTKPLSIYQSSSRFISNSLLNQKLSSFFKRFSQDVLPIPAIVGTYGGSNFLYFTGTVGAGNTPRQKQYQNEMHQVVKQTAERIRKLDFAQLTNMRIEEKNKESQHNKDEKSGQKQGESKIKDHQYEKWKAADDAEGGGLRPNNSDRYKGVKETSKIVGEDLARPEKKDPIGRAIPTKALGGFIYKMEEEDEVEEDDDEGVIAEVRDADRDHAEGAELSGRDPNNRVYEEWTEKAENEARGKGPILNRDVEKEKK